MSKSRVALVRDLRNCERICLKQAELCTVPEARSGLLALAENYRAAAATIEQQLTSDDGSPGGD
jgi:hypothetical protein